MPSRSNMSSICPALNWCCTCFGSTFLRTMVSVSPVAADNFETVTPDSMRAISSFDAIALSRTTRPLPATTGARSYPMSMRCSPLPGRLGDVGAPSFAARLSSASKTERGPYSWSFTVVIQGTDETDTTRDSFANIGDIDRDDDRLASDHADTCVRGADNSTDRCEPLSPPGSVTSVDQKHHAVDTGEHDRDWPDNAECEANQRRVSRTMRSLQEHRGGHDGRDHDSDAEVEQAWSAHAATEEGGTSSHESDGMPVRSSSSLRLFRCGLDCRLNHWPTAEDETPSALASSACENLGGSRTRSSIRCPAVSAVCLAIRMTKVQLFNFKSTLSQTNHASLFQVNDFV